MNKSLALQVIILALAALPASPGMVRSAETADGPTPDLRARPWPEADRLFRRDRRWVGADDAHSVDLGDGRVLWLFGDTLIDPRARGSRRGAALIRNSVGIQTGYDPTTAEMSFSWKTSAEGEPSAFFDTSQAAWFWPGDGIRIGSRLLIFLAVVGSDPNPLGFALNGWRAVLVVNPDSSPEKWRILETKTGSQPFAIILGTGGVLQVDGFVYAYGCDAPGSRVFVARWPTGDAEKGDLSTIQWWGGQTSGWVMPARVQQFPAVLFADGQSEFGVYRDDRIDRYVQIQTTGFGAADLGFRVASRPEGPWSGLSPFYQPQEKKIPGVLIYAAKPHPFLMTGGCAVTYATNLMDPTRLTESDFLYFPHMLQLFWKPSAPSN